MPSSRTKRIFSVLARLGAAAALAAVAAGLLAVLFAGPLVDFLLARASTTFNGDVKVRDASLGFTGLHFQNLQVSDAQGRPVLTVPRGTLGLNPLRVLFQWHWMAALGDLTLEEPGLNVEVDEAGRLNLQRLWPGRRPARKPILARYTGTMTARAGWVHFRDLRQEGFLYRLSGWEGTARFRRDQEAELDLEWVPDQAAPGTLAVAGTYHPAFPRFDLKITIDDLQAFPIAQHPAVRQRLSVHGGRLDGQVWLAARADRWEDLPRQLSYGGRLQFSQGEARLPGIEWPVRRVEARLELVKGRLRVDQGSGLFNGMGFTVTGWFSFPPEAWLELMVTVPRLRPDKVAAMLNRPLPVLGRVRVEVAAEGPPGDLHVTGQLKADRLELEGQVLRQAEVGFRVDGDLVHVERVRARTGDRGVVEGGGYVLLGEDPQLALRLEGRDAAVARGVDIGELELEVLGSARSPLVTGRTRVTGLAALSPYLESMSGRFLYFDGGVVILDGEARVQGGLLEVPYAVLDGRDPYVAGRIVTRGLQLPEVAVPGLGRVTGRLSGRLDVAGRPDLKDLAAHGTLEGTSLVLGPLDLSGITGPLAYSDRMLVLPGMEARGLGGRLDVAGRLDLGGRGATSLVLRGQGVDLQQVASLLHRRLPFRLPGSGDMVASLDGGLGHRAWWAAQAAGSAGYSLAGYGFLDPDGGLGAMAWSDRLPMDGRHLVSRLDLEGTLTAEAGAWGSLRDVSFAYGALVHGSELSGLEGDVVAAVGTGRYQAPVLRLGRGALAWSYARREGRAARLPSLDGRVRPWWGPILSRRLEPGPPSPAPELPDEAVLAFSGTWDFRSRAYDLRYHAQGVDLGWLLAQDWYPEAARLGRTLGITGGVASSSGTLFSDRGKPRLSRDSWFSAPWFEAGGRDGDPPQVYSAVGNVWIGPPEQGRPGRVHLDPVVVSREPWDPSLPGPAALDRVDRRRLAREGLFVVEGWTRGRQVDLRASGEGWDLSELMAFGPGTPWPPDLVTGRVRVEGFRASGVLGPDLFSSLDLTGDVELTGGFVHLGGNLVPVQRLSATVEQRRSQLVLSDLEVDTGMVHLQGQGSRSAAGRWVADLWTDRFPFSYFHYLGRPWTSLEGSGRMALYLDSGTRNPSVYLGLEGEDAVWRGGSQEVRFPRLRLGRVRQADGGYRTGPGLGVRLQTRNGGFFASLPPDGVELEAALEGQEDPTVLSARGDVAFGLPGEGGLASWFAGPHGPEFGTGDEAFRVETRNANVKLLRALAGLRPVDRRVEFDGGLSLQGQWHAGHALAAGPGLPRYEVEASRLEVGVEGEGSWTGVALQDTLRARYQRESQWGRLVVDPFRLAPAGAAAGASGTLEARADLVLTRAREVQDLPDSRLEVGARDFSLASIDFLIPGEQTGSLQELTLTAVGPLLTPELQFAVRMVDGRLGPLAIARVEGGFRGRRTEEPGGYQVEVTGPNGPAELFFGATASPDQRVALSGSIPLAWKREATPPGDRLVPAWADHRLGSAGEMDLQAQMNDNQLRLVDDLVPGITKTSGVLRGSVELSGTLEQPTVSGSLGVENGSFIHPDLGTVSGLNVETRFTEIPAEEAAPALGTIPAGTMVSRLSIEKFEGLLGGKRFTVAGGAEMLGTEPVNVQVSLDGDGLPLQWGGLFEAVGDVHLDLQARPGRLEGVEGTTLIPLVTGDVVLRRGDLNVPLGGLGEGGAGAFRLPVDYRVRLTLGDDVWVHLLGSRIRATSGPEPLRVFPDPETDQPVLSGAVELSRGVLTLPFYDVSFRVVQGRAVFNSDLVPTLDAVEAQTELGGYQITAFVNGKYPDLRVDFVSNPPLAHAEISRLLVMGGLSPYLPGAAGTQAGSQVVSATQFVSGQGLSLLSQFLTAPLSQELGRIFFLSDFSFEVYPPYGFVVKVAKALDDKDRLLLTLTRVINSPQGQGTSDNLYGIEWRFQNNLLLRAAFDQFGQLRTWFQGIWDF